MRAFLILAACSCLLGSTPTREEEFPLVVFPEQACDGGWAVRWEYHGITTVSGHKTAEEARRLYAVLAAVMMER